MTRLLRRLRFLLRRSRYERELDDELQFHLEMKRSDLVSGGHDPAAAGQGRGTPRAGQPAAHPRARAGRLGRAVASDPVAGRPLRTAHTPARPRIHRYGGRHARVGDRGSTAAIFSRQRGSAVIVAGSRVLGEKGLESWHARGRMTRSSPATPRGAPVRNTNRLLHIGGAGTVGGERPRTGAMCPVGKAKQKKGETDTSIGRPIHQGWSGPLGHPRTGSPGGNGDLLGYRAAHVVAALGEAFAVAPDRAAIDPRRRRPGAPWPATDPDSEYLRWDAGQGRRFPESAAESSGGAGGEEGAVLTLC